MIYLTQGIILGLSAAATPGVLQFYFLSQTLRAGWKRTLPAALAPLFSDGPVLALFLLVLSHIPLAVLNGIRLGGGLFILYLAWGAYTSNRGSASVETAAPPAGASSQGLFRAVLMNLLNPNVYIFWATIGAPIVLEGWSHSPWLGWAFILGMYAAMIPANAALIFLFGTTGYLNPRIRRWTGLALAGLLCALGIYQVVTGVLGFVNI